jgi:cobalamin biosynthesis Mg chelatase CobN
LVRPPDPDGPFRCIGAGSGVYQKSNPWALRGVAERLLEAADRGLWVQPDPQTLDRLRSAYLAAE